MDIRVILQKNGIFLKFIKEDLRDYTMCATAVFSNPAAIRFVPPEHLDDEILEHVILSGEKYIELIPYEYLRDSHLNLIHQLYPLTSLVMLMPIKLSKSGFRTLQHVYEIVGYPVNRKFS